MAASTAVNDFGKGVRTSATNFGNRFSFGGGDGGEVDAGDVKGVVPDNTTSNGEVEVRTAGKLKYIGKHWKWMIPLILVVTALFAYGVYCVYVFFAGVRVTVSTGSSGVNGTTGGTTTGGTTGGSTSGGLTGGTGGTTNGITTGGTTGAAGGTPPATTGATWSPLSWTKAPDLVLLTQGASLYSNTLSPPSPYALRMQDDGNLVLYDNKFARWASNTDGKGSGPFQLTMQADGNLVVYASGSNPTWASGTDGKGTGPYKLILRDTPEIAVVDSTGTTLWSSVAAMQTPYQFVATTNTPVQFSPTSVICGIPGANGTISSVGISDGTTCRLENGVSFPAPYQILDAKGATPQWYSNAPNPVHGSGGDLCHYKLNGVDMVGSMFDDGHCGATKTSVYDKLRG